MSKAFEERETIVAVATPVGRGGIGVVRVSGPDALGVVAGFLKMRRPLAAGRARLGEIIDTATGEVLDEVVVTYFAGPRSYTGEDVVEITAHGAPVLLEYLLRTCCAGNARLAEAGEFTRRAFLSGRIDLTQAEAVGDLIEAGTLEQARLAARQLGGAMARHVAPVKVGLVELIAEMEAGIDFAEDDVATLGAEAILARIATVEEPLKRLERSLAYGRVVREGFTLALVGRPNAGKSSLFNRLLERDRSIVTSLPGTTRDTVAERMSIGGIPVELVDTAGLRASSDELNQAEQLGMARSREAMADATVVILVLDAQLSLGPEEREIVDACAGRTLLVALNKMDLISGKEIPAEASIKRLHLNRVSVSALTGSGVDGLRKTIVATLQGEKVEGSEAMVTNLRQQQAVAASLRSLVSAHQAAATAIPHEMMLLDLYEALHALDNLTGVTSTEDLLRLIFERFCVGK